MILNKFNPFPKSLIVQRSHNVSSATFYRWKSKYSGMEASDIKRMKELEAENNKLKKMYAEVALDIAALKDVLSKKW